jgi:hypothetical protein
MCTTHNLAVRATRGTRGNAPRVNRLSPCAAMLTTFPAAIEFTAPAVNLFSNLESFSTYAKSAQLTDYVMLSRPIVRYIAAFTLTIFA